MMIYLSVDRYLIVLKASDRMKTIGLGLGSIVELFDLAITRLHAVGIKGHAGKCNNIVLYLASP